MRSNFSLLAAALIIVIFLFMVSPATAYGTRQLEGDAPYAGILAAFMEQRMAEYKVPGAAVAIVRNGQTELLGSYGRADTAGTPVTPDTPFLLASVSKSMTAVAVMQLVEAGMLDLDAPVQRYLPWFDTGDGKGAEITVAQLVYQTSGLSTLDGRLSTLSPDGPDSLEVGVRSLENLELRFPPGTAWAYSNLNYNTLGLLVQEISGQPFGRYLEDTVFKPLGMEHTFTSLQAARQQGAASGFYPFFGIPLSLDRLMVYSGATLPSAGVWSTASDLSRYMLFHLGDDGAVLSKSGLEDLHTSGAVRPSGNGYAMGWYKETNFLDPEYLATLGTDLDLEADLAILYHGGDWANYKSVVLMIPSQDLGVTLLMNSNDPTVNSGLRGIAWDIAVIATGGQAQYFPPFEENFLLRNLRWLLGLTTILMFGEFAWAAKDVRRCRDLGAARLWLPATLEITLIGFLFLVQLPENDTTWYLMLRNGGPDGALLLVIMTAVCTLRWWLAIRRTLSARKAEVR